MTRARKIKGDGTKPNPLAPRTFHKPPVSGPNCNKCRNLTVGARGAVSCKAGGPLAPCEAFDDCSKPRTRPVGGTSQIVAKP